MIPLTYNDIYSAFHELHTQRLARLQEECVPRSRFQKYLRKTDPNKSIDLNGFTRMQKCRDALNAIDTKGWNRSFHQRMFHDQFIRASARVFFKNDPPGSFARAHQAILDMNSWETLSQEVLISTPRRFGKTISVSMFAAAMIYAAPDVEISIYSTCKRISQKLLRNVQKFLSIIYQALKEEPLKVIRSNMEEIVLQGSESKVAGMDVRIVNSYPSKVIILY